MSSEPRFNALTGQHIPYWNTVLQADFCHADGEDWPCLFYRQNRPAKCLCSHVKHDGICWSRPCGCREYRADDVGIPARLDERYDPSPEPIDRKIQ